MPAQPTRNDRLKASWPTRLWSSLIAATILHLAVFALWPAVDVQAMATEETVSEIMTLPEFDLPEPPEPITRPAVPLVTSADVPLDATMAETTFEANPPTEVPPPPSQTEARGAGVSAFVPYTVPPRLLNGPEIQAALAREYPDHLRDAGVEGVVQVYFHLDAEGRIVERRVVESSGFAPFDEAALAVADGMRFSPALNRDQQVAVGVTFAIQFRIR